MARLENSIAWKTPLATFSRIHGAIALLATITAIGLAQNLRVHNHITIHDSQYTYQFPRNKKKKHINDGISD